jgi:hypothetical protein
MTQISISAASIRDVGIYEEDGAVVLGFQLGPKGPFKSLILQIDTEDSDQRQDLLGMHAEFDGKGAYGAVKKFEFVETGSLVKVEFMPEKANGFDLLSIDISGLGPPDRKLLARMANTFKDYPRRAG